MSHIGKLLTLSQVLLIIASGIAVNIKIPISKQLSSGGRGSRIAGGSEAARNQFPFAVIFFISDVDDDQSICGGSIISSTFVLSAAHCFIEMYTADLLAGVHNVELEYPDYEITLFPNDVIIHENYDRARHANDVAVVKVSRKPFIFGNSIQYIQIIPRSMASANLTGVIGRVSGW